MTIERVACVTNKIQIVPKPTMSGNLQRGIHSEVTKSSGSSASEENSRSMTKSKWGEIMKKLDGASSYLSSSEEYIHLIREKRGNVLGIDNA